MYRIVTPHAILCYTIYLFLAQWCLYNRWVVNKSYKLPIKYMSAKEDAEAGGGCDPDILRGGIPKL